MMKIKKLILLHLIMISRPTFSQETDSLSLAYLTLVRDEIVKIIANLDTSCVLGGIHVKSDIAEDYCGIMANNLKIGKWLNYNDKSQLENISFYNNEGKRYLFLNYSSIKKKVISGSYITSDGLKFFFDSDGITIISLTKVLSDTIQFVVNFYPNGAVDSYGLMYVYGFLNEPPQFTEGTGKHEEWRYFSEDGNLIRSENYMRGILKE